MRNKGSERGTKEEEASRDTMLRKEAGGRGGKTHSQSVGGRWRWWTSQTDFRKRCLVTSEKAPKCTG